MSKLDKCPWCGGSSCVHVFNKRGEWRTQWKCGSEVCGEGQPWQSPDCREVELEMANERIEKRIAELEALVKRLQKVANAAKTIDEVRQNGLEYRFGYEQVFDAACEMLAERLAELKEA